MKTETIEELKRIELDRMVSHQAELLRAVRDLDPGQIKHINDVFETMLQKLRVVRGIFGFDKKG